MEKTVQRLQARIVKAQQECKYGRVKSLTRILTRSFAAKVIAVERVTSNQGSRTPGIDGIKWNTAKCKTQAILELQQESYRAKPLRRKYIQKQNSTKMRPLGIPTMKDRAMQALHNTALLPISETTADLNSYGFRPFRCCQDAIMQIAKMMSRNTRPQWILEGDIKGCFDNISHEWVMENIPVEKRILFQWLKCGYLEQNQLYPTKSGTPQGGTISPTIANMTLDGIESMLNVKYKIRSKFKGRRCWICPPSKENRHVNFIRYADDFIVTGNSKEVLENEVKPMIKAFLMERGLELSEEKTLTTHIENGFDFLGFNVRTYNGKLLIHPAADRVKRLMQKIDDLLKRYRSISPQILIDKLNPILRGWANYYRYVSSSATFAKIAHWLWGKLWHWACRRHQKKNKAWIKQKYFFRILGKDWVFAAKDKNGHIISLFDITHVKIRRHIKIKASYNPFAQEDADYLH